MNTTMKKTSLFAGIGGFILLFCTLFGVKYTWFWGETVRIQDVHTKEVVSVKLHKSMRTHIRFRIKGQIDGPATFYWNCTAQTRESCSLEQRVEGGSVDISAGGDWYSDTYTFVYEPSLEARHGSIQIRYE